MLVVLTRGGAQSRKSRCSVPISNAFNCFLQQVIKKILFDVWDEVKQNQQSSFGKLYSRDLVSNFKFEIDALNGAFSECPIKPWKKCHKCQA